MAILVLDHVVKRFGDFTAVDDLRFSVPEGGVFGFLGGNGAGKTTSLRMALDILRPTSGRIEILGRAPGRENASEIGFLPEERGLYRRMKVLETIVYFGELKGMSAANATTEGKRLIERFGLGEWTKATVDKLSKGMQQKVQVAAAMVNSPRLLILDEPFSGLDPVNQQVLEDLVLEMAAKGTTVVFSTHVMQHAERMTDRLLLLARGKKVFEGTQEEARARLPGRLSITSQADPSTLPGVLGATRTGGADGWSDWTIELKPGSDQGALLQQCTTNGFALRRFEIHRPSLHDVFIQLVGAGQEIVK
ncbi:MAG TPA: ATP-binding cassette domain-containing protein [Hyphomonadaceae bacterium]|nr:ATP-binding cassette domain-containing protein [Hyphomonadaceae bacterium]